MKKIFSIVLKSILGINLGIIFVALSNKEIKASSDTAGLKGINVSNLEYVTDSLKHEKEQSKDAKTYEERFAINGSKYLYGYVSLWTTIYRIYNEKEDRMIYYVFADTHIEGIKNTSKGFYHANKINLKINSSYIGVNRASYQPQENSYNISQSSSDTKSVTYGSSVNSKGEVGLSGSMNYAYSYTEMVNSKDVSLYTTENIGDNYFTQIFEYNFINANRGSDSEREPYIGDYGRISVVTFEYDNYKSRNKKLDFDIEYSGEIFRKSKTKSDNYTMERTISHKYKLKDNEVTFEKDALNARDI